MGRSVEIGGETCFYVANWNAPYFEPLAGKTVSQAVGMVLQSMNLVNEQMVAKNMNIPAPRCAKADVGKYGCSQDDRWWYGVGLDNEDDKLGVTFHTLLTFLNLLLRCSGFGRGWALIRLEHFSFMTPRSDEDSDSE